MNTKARWGTGQTRLQIYLPDNVQAALDKYIAEKYSPSSRVVSAIVRRAISEFLVKEGYLAQQGGGKM